MSNIKEVVIEGYVPFNTYDHPRLNTLLGQVNSPVFGIRVEYQWSGMPGERLLARALHRHAGRGPETEQARRHDELHALPVGRSRGGAGGMVGAGRLGGRPGDRTWRTGAPSSPATSIARS